MKEESITFKEAIKEGYADLRKCNGFILITTTKDEQVNLKQMVLGKINSRLIFTLLRSLSDVSKHLWDQIRDYEKSLEKSESKR